MPNRVLVVDKRLVSTDSTPFEFVQLAHPRTNQEQSFAIDRSSNTVFELVQCHRSHASWFIDDHYVVPDGSLYLLTPIHLNFLLLPALRTHSVPLATIISLPALDEQYILDKLRAVCDVDDESRSVVLNSKKLLTWLEDRLDRLAAHLTDREHAFDVLSQYLSDGMIEQCRSAWKPATVKAKRAQRMN